MTLTQVGKFMPEGYRAFGDLLNMLFEAAAACKVTARLSATRNSIGLALDGGKYGLFVPFTESETVYFQTRCRIDREAAQRLGVGEVGEEGWIPGRSCWWRSAELNSEEVHFFLRNKVSQFEWLEGFLRDCLAKARSIETPDQPPIPDEPEES